MTLNHARRYDFMVTDQFDVYLIEANTNPCMEFSCPLLEALLSQLMEDTFRVAVDPLFPPPTTSARSRSCEEAVQALQMAGHGFEQLYP
jgi:hypothetical protein